MINEVIKLVFEMRNGSLKINSSIIGNSNAIFKIFIEVNLNSLREGNKLKYLNGAIINIPVIISIIRIIRNEIHTSFKKEDMDLISNSFPGVGFLRNRIISLK
jgi:hypothetical protein